MTTEDWQPPDHCYTATSYFLFNTHSQHHFKVSLLMLAARFLAKSGLPCGHWTKGNPFRFPDHPTPSTAHALWSILGVLTPTSWGSTVQPVYWGAVHQPFGFWGAVHKPTSSSTRSATEVLTNVVVNFRSNNCQVFIASEGSP